MRRRVRTLVADWIQSGMIISVRNPGAKAFIISLPNAARLEAALEAQQQTWAKASHEP